MKRTVGEAKRCGWVVLGKGGRCKEDDAKRERQRKREKELKPKKGEDEREREINEH